MDPDIRPFCSNSFNDQYNASQKLINRLLEESMESSFPKTKKSSTQVKLPPPTVREVKNLPRMHGITNRHEMCDGSVANIHTSQEDLRENSLHAVSIPLDYLDPLSPARTVLRSAVPMESSDDEDPDALASSILFLGSEYLPEYSYLSQTATKCNGTIDLSHLNFGNHRIAILSEKLAQCGRDHEVVSLCLRCVRIIITMCVNEIYQITFP